jgi:hypothetical protein
MDPKTFFRELRRRNVLKVGLAYAVIAWLVAEVAALLFKAWGTPEGVMQALVIVIGAGFPLALVIAWSFEMTPQGMKRTHNVLPGEAIPYWSRRKFFTMIASVSVAAIALLIYQWATR